jgi:hypothetical protein
MRNESGGGVHGAGDGDVSVLRHRVSVRFS